MLPGFIIEEIRKREEEQEDRREQPRVYIHKIVPLYMPEMDDDNRGISEEQIWGPSRDDGGTVVNVFEINYFPRKSF